MQTRSALSEQPEAQKISGAFSVKLTSARLTDCGLSFLPANECYFENRHKPALLPSLPDDANRAAGVSSWDPRECQPGNIFPTVLLHQSAKVTRIVHGVWSELLTSRFLHEK